MTSPSRKNLQTTAWKIPCPVNPARLLRCVLCIAVVAVGTSAVSDASFGQYQQPQRFQKPNAVRSILGVRNSSGPQSSSRQPSSRQLSSRQLSPPQRGARQPANFSQPNNFSGNSEYESRNQPSRNQSRRDSIVMAAPRNAQSVQYQEPVTFRDPITQSGAIGSGVRENRNIASRPSQANGVQYQRSNSEQQHVDPTRDPFGDRSAAKLVPPKLNSAQMHSTPRSAKRPSRAPIPRPSYVPSRNQIAAAGYPQESILRQPRTSNSSAQTAPQPFRSSNAGYNPSGFQPPANYKRLEQEIPDPAQGGGGFDPNANQPMENQPMGQPRVEPNNLRQPMQQDPIQEADPMQVDPMDQDPMQQDPMDRQRNTFDLDCEEINGVMLQRKIRDIALTLKPNLDEGRTVPEFCSFEGIPSAPRCWAPQTFVWTASAICTKPLYYQDIQLERYGHTRGPIIQPILSVAHFFGNVAINPYKAGIHPPNECMYVLGYYRPGDCAPWLIEPFPWSIRGAAGQAASAVGYSGIFR